MTTPRPFADRTILMSGGSRGIGLAIALRASRDGANVAFIAKTAAPDPRLPGTVHTAAAAIEEVGGQALPIVGDIRDDDIIAEAVAQTVDRFGGIDIVINNASAIALTGIGELPVKRYDLIHDINARGTFALTSAALPHLLKSPAPRVLTLSPPLNLDRRWLAEHAPYTVSKYAMTLLTLGVAEQYREQGIAASCLWPRTLVATAAVRNVVAGDEGMRSSRRPEIMSDAAALILSLPADEANGQCFVDEDVLRAAGVTDFSGYLNDGATEENLEIDLFL
ncbi:SDR family oxidoreductase [Streptomyces justiciae]|uniref:SDR family oxidoreductase n=1 Tax=Streptomyces justiciae TaxID=2780140 RepID=UPI002117ED05|nr:NAD(P)-dependent oxidoreductase [Streptomyces justiciae]MCW8378709.1 NAD(P)-dependent oxidoreductase [Streptomyces justiciae]